MGSENQPPDNFQNIDPEDFLDYEDSFIEKGGGGGSGGKGKKTLKALKKEQKTQSHERRKQEVENSLIQILRGFPPISNRDLELKYLDRYIRWAVANITEMAPLDMSEIEITFSKSGGPGGQNVNKRETRVSMIHLPTHIRAESDQTRTQLQNKNLALKLLQARLQNHINDWKEYLAPSQIVDLELVQILLDK